MNGLAVVEKWREEKFMCFRTFAKYLGGRKKCVAWKVCRLLEAHETMPCTLLEIIIPGESINGIGPRNYFTWTF